MQPVRLKLVYHARNDNRGNTIADDVIFNSIDLPQLKIDDFIEIYHPEERLRLPLKVTSIRKDGVQKGTISIEQSLAIRFKFKNYKEVFVCSLDPETITLDHVEIEFKEQYVSHSDFYRFTESMRCMLIYYNQKLEHIRCVRAGQVGDMWKDGEKVYCGLVGANTKIILRSSTSVVHIFIQMSTEMWDFNYYGELYFEKTLQFLMELFTKWKENHCNHDVTIILFSRIFYEATSLEEFPEVFRKYVCQDYRGYFFEDFYHVIVQNERYTEEWHRVLLKMKSIFQKYLPLITESVNRFKNENQSVPKLYNSNATEGNLLEALNLTLNLYEAHNIDRNFDRTGKLCFVITPGSGLLEVDKELVGITKQRFLDLGVGMDLICMGEQPLHAVPLFKFKNKRAGEGTAVGDFYMPHWMHHSFYRSPSELQAIRLGNFVPRIKFSCTSKNSSTGEVMPVNKNTIPELEPNAMENHDNNVFLWMKKVRRSTESYVTGHFDRLQYMLPLSPSQMMMSSTPSSAGKAGSIPPNLAGLNSSKQSRGGGGEGGNRPSYIPPRNRHRSCHPQVDLKEVGDIVDQVMAEDQSRTSSSHDSHSSSIERSLSLEKISEDTEGTNEEGVSTGVNMESKRSHRPSSLSCSDQARQMEVGIIPQRSREMSASRVLPLKQSSVAGGKGGLAQSGFGGTPMMMSATHGSNTSLSGLSNCGQFKALFNPFAPNRLNIRVTTNRRRWAHVFPLDKAGNPILPHILRETDVISSQAMWNEKASLGEAWQKSLKIRQEIFENQMQSINDQLVSAHLLIDPQEAFVDKVTSTKEVATKSHQTSIDNNKTKIENNKNRGTKLGKNVRSLFAEGEQKWAWEGFDDDISPVRHMGVDWKSLVRPACLPVTTDYFPDQNSLAKKYVTNVYAVVVAATSQEDSTFGKPRRSLTPDEAFRELMNQRFTQGFQIVVPSANVGKCPVSFAPSLPSAMAVGQKSSQKQATNVYKFSFNSLHHILTMGDDSIKVTRYEPLPQNTHHVDPISYKYRLKIPDSQHYVFSWTEFRTEALESFNWNYLDSYICTRGDDDTYGLVPSTKYWKSRFIVLPSNNPATKSIFESINKNGHSHIRADIYEDRNETEIMTVMETFVRFIESINKIRRQMKFTFDPNEFANSSPITSGSAQTFKTSANNLSTNYLPTNDSALTYTESMPQLDRDHLSLNSPYSRLVNTMLHSKHGISFINSPNTFPPHTFVSHEAVHWVINNVQGAKSIKEACNLLQSMCRERYICHASGNQSHQFLYGFYLYSICELPTNHHLTGPEGQLSSNNPQPLVHSNPQSSVALATVMNNASNTSTGTTTTLSSTSTTFNQLTTPRKCDTPILPLNNITSSSSHANTSIRTAFANFQFEWMEVNFCVSDKCAKHNYNKADRDTLQSSRPLGTTSQHGSSSSLLEPIESLTPNNTKKRQSIPSAQDVKASDLLLSAATERISGSEPNVFTNNTATPAFRQLPDNSMYKYLHTEAEAYSHFGFTRSPGVIVHDGVLHKKVTVDIDIQENTDRVEWGTCEYHANYHPDYAFQMEVQWLVATGGKLSELVNNWRRKAEGFSLLFLPVPCDAFALPYNPLSDPLREPIFVPLATDCLKFHDGSTLSDSTEPVKFSKLAYFMELILKKFGFLRDACVSENWQNAEKNYLSKHPTVSHQAPQEEYTDGRQRTYAITSPPSMTLDEGRNHHHQPLSNNMSSGLKFTPRVVDHSNSSCIQTAHLSYVHCTGGMFVLLCCPRDEGQDTHAAHDDYITAQASLIKGRSQISELDRVGFLWAWNFMLTKRWRSSHTGDESFQDALLGDFRRFCSNRDVRLSSLWHQFTRQESFLADKVNFPVNERLKNRAQSLSVKERANSVLKERITTTTETATAATTTMDSSIISTESSINAESTIVSMDTTLMDTTTTTSTTTTRSRAKSGPSGDVGGATTSAIISTPSTSPFLTLATSTVMGKDLRRPKPISLIPTDESNNRQTPPPSLQ